MPVVRDLNGAWLVPPWAARAFVPMIREKVNELIAAKQKIHPSWLAELAEGEESARWGRDPDANPDANPDAAAGTPGQPGNVGSVGKDVVRGIRRAAAIVGCSPSALHERCRRGTLPYELGDRGVFLFRVENLQKGRSRGQLSA